MTLPLAVVFSFFLYAYLFGRNLPYLIFIGLLILATPLAPSSGRFLLWPLVLLLLAAALSRPSPLWIAGLSFWQLAKRSSRPRPARRFSP